MSDGTDSRGDDADSLGTDHRAVLFDMDGVAGLRPSARRAVLVDSERYWVERERETIFPATVEESVDPAEITGMNVPDLYDYSSVWNR